MDDNTNVRAQFISGKKKGSYRKKTIITEVVSTKNFFSFFSPRHILFDTYKAIIYYLNINWETQSYRPNQQE